MNNLEQLIAAEVKAAKTFGYKVTFTHEDLVDPDFDRKAELGMVDRATFQSSDLRGITNTRTKTIRVRYDIPTLDEKFCTVAHELAHGLLHVATDPENPPVSSSLLRAMLRQVLASLAKDDKQADYWEQGIQYVAEVEADTVAVRVAKHFNVGTKAMRRDSVPTLDELVAKGAVPEVPPYIPTYADKIIKAIEAARGQA